MKEHNNRQMEKISSQRMEPFSIRRLDEHCYRMSCPTPMMRSIVNCFIFLSQGEVLIEGEEQKNVFVRENEFLLIPQGVAFSVKYYKDSVGYMEAPSILPIWEVIRFPRKHLGRFVCYSCANR